MFTTTDLLLFGIISAIIAMFFALLSRRKTSRAKRRSAPSLFFARFFGIWWLLIAVFLLFKVRMLLASEPGDPFNSINLVPFKTISSNLRTLNYAQFLGNVLILIPLPALLYYNFPRIRTGNIFLISFFMTVLIEPVQLLINMITQTSTNVIDVDDFILNAAGWLIGFLMFLILKYIAPVRRK